MIFGLDLLAGAKYQKEAIACLPAGWALGGFDNTFGDFLPVAKNALIKGCPHVRIHMLWSDSHTFGDRDIPKIKRIAEKWEKVAKAYPNSVIELSPFCEHNLKNPDKYLDIVQNSAPSCSIVNTPWRGSLSRKYKNEIHGDHSKPGGSYNYSYDGTNCVDENVTKDKQTHANAEVFFFWHVRFNLKWSMKDTTPRPQRTARPSKDLIKSIVYLARDKGPVSVPRKWLIKSHSEKHDAMDQKGDKLLIITPIRTQEITLKRNGKVIARLPYYAQFSEGGYRHYARTMGYKIGQVEIWIGNKQYGTCDCGFRDPVYR